MRDVPYLIHYCCAAHPLPSEGAGRHPSISERGPDSTGKGLFRLQMGEQIGMPNSRPMPAVATGVSELRVKTQDGAYRAFYYTASAQGVLVFHVARQ